MTNVGTIMTTDLRLIYASSLFTDNDVLRLEGHTWSEIELAGLGWFGVGQMPRHTHLRALQYASVAVLERLRGYGLYLLACHSCWQPDSRIVHHRGLWGAFAARGISIPSGVEVASGMMEHDGKVRFFGALQVEVGCLNAVSEILEEEPASHLVALERTNVPVVRALTQQGWASRGPLVLGRPDERVLARICDADGVVLWFVGAFDDRESGCVAIGKPRLVVSLR